MSDGIPEFRIGQGFDVHPWSSDPARHLVLGGVTFDDSPGLAGHSDADVIAHAITDAMLGAVGLGDIGQHFPDTSPEFAGADSLTLLASARAAVADAGWRVVNADCTVILDRPKLAPHREAMQQRVSEALGAPVSIKGKRTEGVEGLAGGVQCHAVALCVRSDAAIDRAKR
ncbi:MAG: 2-C-methyl-D-erythritol 2,4-cyclodiphosphate synthase [Acidimicrobiales bacterium]